MVDFGKLRQREADRKMAAEIIINEIEEELGNQIVWWDQEEAKKFRDKYIPKLCRMP